MSGLRAVFWKELEDAFISWRFVILFILIVAIAVFAIQGAFNNIRAELADQTTEFVFLRLFTVSGEQMQMTFLNFISIFIPIVGIMLGFDAINSEKNSGTMSRLLSQPIYRDVVINGKFLAGVVTITVMMLSVVLLITGMGLRMIGVPPTSEELVRVMAFFGVSIIYGAFWLSLAMLFSIFFQRVATSALASIGVWIFFTFFLSMVATAAANVIVPAGETEEMATMLARVSPFTLFQEGVHVLLVPESRIVGATRYYGNPLPVSQSALIVWPQIVGLIAATVVCFAISYAKFIREEIRST